MKRPPAAASSMAFLDAAITSSTDPCSMTRVVCRLPFRTILWPYCRLSSARLRRLWVAGFAQCRWADREVAGTRPSAGLEESETERRYDPNRLPSLFVNSGVNRNGRVEANHVQAGSHSGDVSQIGDINAGTSEVPPMTDLGWIGRIADVHDQ